VTPRAAAEQIAAEFPSRWLSGYARWKIRTDPMYEIVRELIATSSLPLLDIGCGMGLLSFYLHACDDRRETLGIDFDERKIASGTAVASRLGARTRFLRGDARQPADFRGHVALLDLLHYFQPEEQAAIVRNAAKSTADGGLLIIRDCMHDSSWRYYVTVGQERFSRAIGWLRGERLSFPTRESIVSAATAEGLTLREIRPLWFKTPFNNYLLVFAREQL
jgi:SAM-dependent methyltransferase